MQKETCVDIPSDGVVAATGQPIAGRVMVPCSIIIYAKGPGDRNRSIDIISVNAPGNPRRTRSNGGTKYERTNEALVCRFVSSSVPYLIGVRDGTRLLQSSSRCYDSHSLYNTACDDDSQENDSIVIYIVHKDQRGRAAGYS